MQGLERWRGGVVRTAMRLNYVGRALAMTVIVVALMFSLSGCVSGSAVHEDFTARWAGKPLDEFTIRYGLASGSQRLKDGRTVVEWSDRYGVGNNGSPLVGLGASIGGAENQAGSFQLSCQLRMVIDPAGRIEQVTVTKDTIGRWVNSRCAEVLKGD